MRVESNRPRFWISIALLLLAQLSHPAICAPRWNSPNKREAGIEEESSVGEEEAFSLDEISREEFLDDNNNNDDDFYDLGHQDESCEFPNGPCDSATPQPYSALITIGKNLLKGLKIIGTISGATCLSLSVASLVNCGGLTHDACRRYKDIKSSMDHLKETASLALDENAELRRLNATNRQILSQLETIKIKMELIVEKNAEMMEAMGVLRFNETPTDMRPDETKDEYDVELQKKKLVIETDMEQYVNSLQDRISRMGGGESAAFAAVAGVSLMVQLMPAFLRGIRRLHLAKINVNDLNVVVKSPTSGVSMAVNMKTGKNYFVEVSRGTVTKVLGKVGKDGGMGGMFDIFASKSTKTKINEFLAEEKMIHSRSRVGKAGVKCTNANLEKLADWTKDMDKIELDEFLSEVLKDEEGADNFLDQDNNKPKIGKTAPNKGGIMSKLTARFKPVGKFFGKVKNSLKAVKVSIGKTRAWQGMQKFGFKAIGALMSAASIAMCVTQSIHTIKGALEMDVKLRNTSGNIEEAQSTLDQSRGNISFIAGLQKELFKNLTLDSIAMVKFFSNASSLKTDFNSNLTKFKRAVAKETPKFDELMKKMRRPNISGHELYSQLEEFKKLLTECYRALVRIYNKVKVSNFIKSAIKRRYSVKDILQNLRDANLKVEGTFEILLEIAELRKDLNEYNNYPLSCIRKGIIKDQLSLDRYMESSGTVVIGDRVRNAIRTAVDFWGSSVDKTNRNIVKLLKMQQLKCDGRDCNRDDILSVIADLYQNKKEYDDYDLEKYRKQTAGC